MRTFRIIATAVALTALTGCVTVGPKLKPVQMYRFGFDPALLDDKAALTAGGNGMPPVGVVLGTVTFPQDSGGDRITTVEGNEVSYVSQSRWTAPAQELFNEAVSAGFGYSDRVRLESRGPSAANYRLDIAVRQFESDYSHNRPTVAIEFDARLIRLDDKAVVGDKYITESIPVGHNDMSMMADTYDKATTRAVAQLIAFCQDTLVTAGGTQTPTPEQPSDGTQKVEGL